MARKLTVTDVAEALGMHPQTVRVFIQYNAYPFAVCVKAPGSSRYTYTIFPAKFQEYIANRGKGEVEA